MGTIVIMVILVCFFCNCLECEPCYSLGGKCNGGPQGNGLCSCFPGWIGADCSDLVGRKDFYSTWEFQDPNDPYRVM
jgi:hypothetical protein